ncbi:hypothetical protein MHYP_G00109540 [Metynnis hypsauchen]
MNSFSKGVPFIPTPNSDFSNCNQQVCCSLETSYHRYHNQGSRQACQAVYGEHARLLIQSVETRCQTQLGHLESIQEPVLFDTLTFEEPRAGVPLPRRGDEADKSAADQKAEVASSCRFFKSVHVRRPGDTIMDRFRNSEH